MNRTPRTRYTRPRHVGLHRDTLDHLVVIDPGTTERDRHTRIRRQSISLWAAALVALVAGIAGPLALGPVTRAGLDQLTEPDPLPLLLVITGFLGAVLVGLRCAGLAYTAVRALLDPATRRGPASVIGSLYWLTDTDAQRVRLSPDDARTVHQLIWEAAEIDRARTAATPHDTATDPTHDDRVYEALAAVRTELNQLEDTARALASPVETLPQRPVAPDGMAEVARLRAVLDAADSRRRVTREARPHASSGGAA